MSFTDAVVSALAANQFLAGGVGAIAFGAVMYVLRSVPEAILCAIEQIVWIKVQVDSLSNEFADVDGFIEKRRFAFFGRSLEIRDGALKTGHGGGWGRYDGVLFKYSKSRATNQITPLETLSVSFLTRDRGVVARFLADCRPEDHRNSIHISLFSATGSDGGMRRRKRSLSTVFVDTAIKERLVSRFSWFLGAEEWHGARGIPWKLGVALYGPPGSGKTSLIHALASDFDFDIKYVKSLHGLGAAFKTGTPTDLFVIEDIDTISAGLDRETRAGKPAEEATRGSPLHEILNAMDGMQTPDGLKFIITTNHLDRLDPAILRPGRIDEAIEIGPLSRDSARDMFRAFYGRDGIEEYAPRTGAELQQLFSTKTAEEAEAALEGR